MKEATVSNALLREFLLGKVDEEERQRIESLFLTDSQARERVLAAEQDLIEDYLEDSLTTADKETFISLYARTPAQQRQLRITKLLKEKASTEAVVDEADASEFSAWARLRARLRLKPALVVPFAVTAIVVIVIAAVWLYSTNKQHLAMQQELARLNTSAGLREVPLQMDRLELRPGTVRSVERQIEFKPRADIQLVELRLLLVQKERYPTYQAEIRRVGDKGQSFTIRDLHAEEDNQFIRIRLPSRLLSRGHYQILLSGISSDGSSTEAEEYSFAVGS
jgi:hypothetical protein